jgi:hypothetical protein
MREFMMSKTEAGKTELNNMGEEKWIRHLV